MTPPLLVRGLLAVLAVGAAGALAPPATTQGPQPSTPVFAPPLTTPESLAPFLAHVDPAGDTFDSERDAAIVEARLRVLGDWLAAGAARSASPGVLFAPGFRGGRVWAASEATAGGPALEIQRDEGGDSREADREASACLEDLRRLATRLGPVRVTEFEVTAIERTGPSEVRATVRAEIAGATAAGARGSYVGTWQTTWRTEAAGWQMTAWTAGSSVTARALRPLFTEITAASLGATDAFRRQLTAPLDAWNATMDSVITRDSNGHHGVAVGDADGDGLEDLYVAQPSGLPNRLLRARGDGTFEDITEASGAGLLDDSAQPLFADVDNDGDQDLVIATSVQPLLLRNDGRGRYEVVEEAFTFASPLQGVLTGVTMADFDRDGFLDAYLSVYSYFFGAGDDKAGTPMPYHDARNGPPGVLFRNDGRGRFVDVTREVGLDEGNDRYHFAAAWADYDEDGWPDLFVANDFGTKNLYRNLGRQADGRVRFEDVAAKAGVLDHGAGMSATFVDYDNDGRLDIYAGNMWAAPGQRVTADSRFLPAAPPDVRAQYRRHARGNALFRNRGDGTFEDVTIGAGASMGRWAWSSDAVDVDSDGHQDLYVANGMLTRTGPSAGRDLEGFFWRQVVARSPLSRVKGTPYDEAWRAMNSLLVHGSIASRQRNVLLRNDGHGRFDEVSGASGLDLDQDGRAFAALDLDRDGDPDLAVMAARQAPQLRLFRNEHPARRVLAIRLTGTTSNRDAIGARVRVETDAGPLVRVVHTARGFLSQHSREILVGLGDRQVRSLDVVWPSGTRQTFTDVSANMRYRLVEGGRLEGEPIVRRHAPAVADQGPATSASLPVATWLYDPFPAPEFSHPDLAGTMRSLQALKGKPAVLAFWQASAAEARRFVARLAEGRRTLDAAGIGVLAIAVDGPDAGAAVRAAAPPGLPVVHASRDLALTWALVYRHLFMNRPAMPLPTTLLVDAEGRITRVWRGAADIPSLVEAARTPLPTDHISRLSRALPFPGRFIAPLGPRNHVPLARELIEEGLDAPAVEALERASTASPTAATLYRLGTLLEKTGEPARARAAFERALALDPSMAEAHNDLGTLQAQAGDLEGAIARFRQALAAMPDYPDALNNLGYALLLTGQAGEARTLYERALALQPDFPEALNNLGLLLGRAGDLAAAERYFREALARREVYGEAANNLALVLVARGAEAEALAVLQAQLAAAPGFEGTYVTLAKLHLAAGRTAEGLAVLERLLQRNPTHPIALELVKAYR